MKLTVFQSDQGDCMLLTADETRMLIDGGMTGSYSEHVAPALGELRSAGLPLDVVYLSHIDSDHIRGVLRLLDDELEWRVHEFQLDAGNEDHPEPGSPRPPEVRDLWHNGFSAMVEQNEGEIEDLFAARAAVFQSSSDPELLDAALRQRELATSVPEAITLSNRVGPEQLGIPLNGAFGGKLTVLQDDSESLDMGPLRLTMLGPTKQDLEALRTDWNEWLQKNKTKLAELHTTMREDAERLASGEIRDVRARLDAAAGELAERASVTVPNLASLMFMVEEGERRLLLTGDGHARDIEHGLELAKALDDDQGRIHVEALKVQHHGSEHNVDAQFCRQVSADHYVYCANGAHHNPDLVRLQELLDSRLGPPDARNTHPKAEGPFKLWVNSSSEADTSQTNNDHMREVERIVSEAAAASGGRMSFEFLAGASFEIEI